VFLAITRRWRPVVYIATLMAGEITAFLAAAAIVRRPRPGVSHLDSHLPTSSYPSGHTAATTCMYVAIAVLVIGLSRGWWRWLFVIPAVVLPALVALSRVYRGEHHPTDVLAGALFAALWVTAVTLLIRPAIVARDRLATSRSRDATSTSLPRAKQRPLTRPLSSPRQS
jgi:undecaprenyl-diphosphatase